MNAKCAIPERFITRIKGHNVHMASQVSLYKRQILMNRQMIKFCERVKKRGKSFLERQNFMQNVNKVVVTVGAI